MSQGFSYGDELKIAVVLHSGVADAFGHCVVCGEPNIEQSSNSFTLPWLCCARCGKPLQACRPCCHEHRCNPLLVEPESHTKSEREWLAEFGALWVPPIPERRKPE